MATQTTGGGSTTSFTNTPQAKDDLLTSAQTGLTEDSTGTVYLDVMANDGAGKAKVLWSLDDGDNDCGAMNGYEAADLLSQDVARTAAASRDTSAHGARIWITADGKVAYDPSTLQQAFKDQLQALPEGQTLSDTFIYAIRMANGTLSWAEATVEFAGVNDIASISGDYTGDVVENGTLTASGTIIVSDVDAGQNELQPIAAGTAGDNGYGSFEVNADGTWTYTLNDALDAVQSLPEGGTLTDTITVTSEDGTASQEITITITGTNDIATISGVATGDVVENGTLTTGGKLDVADIDTGEAELQPMADAAGDNGYGTFQVAADGTWSYTLNDALDAVQALPEGATLTDTITVSSEDGTDTQVITVTITGTNDLATISGDVTGDVVENGDLTATGTLVIEDIDTGEAELQPATAAGDNGYGTFAVAADGSWTYALNDDLDAVQSLPEGATLTDAITVTSKDGTDTQVITVTITGTNDVAVIGGADTGSVTEDGTLIATGALTVDDVDAGEELFVASSISGAYGSLEFAADGSWTYTLDNDDLDLADLDTGESAQEVFTVESADGTEHQISVTVNGANEAAAYTPPPVYTEAGDPNDFDSTGDNNMGEGTPGNDQIRGTAGADTINGGTGNDTIYTGAGSDSITSGPDAGSPPPNDNDNVFGGSGDDTIHGGRGNDSLHGGSGNDTISAADGNDDITGGYGADTLTGGLGSDDFVYLSARDTGDIITDFSSVDDSLVFTGLGLHHTNGTGQLTGEGEVDAHGVGWFSHDGVTDVYADLTGDGIVDLQITLSNGATLNAADLIV